MSKERRHIGSDFDDFLKDEGLFDEVDAAAVKSLIALQIRDELYEQGIAKAELARRMRSSRAAVDRLLDINNPSVTLLTLAKAAGALNKRLVVSLAG